MPTDNPRATTILPEAILHMLTPAALHEVLWAAHRAGHAEAVVQVMAVLMCRMAATAGWPWAVPVESAPVKPAPIRSSGRARRKRMAADLEGDKVT